MIHCKYFRFDRLSLKPKQDVTSLWFLVNCGLAGGLVFSGSLAWSKTAKDPTATKDIVFLGTWGFLAQPAWEVCCRDKGWRNPWGPTSDVGTCSDPLYFETGCPPTSKSKKKKTKNKKQSYSADVKLESSVGKKLGNFGALSLLK